MNSQGRHYRDPADPSNPSCNYVVSNGASCTFFQDSPHAELNYLEDVTFGPVNDNPENPNPELATILALLNEQKAASERQQILQQQQAAQMQQLQSQVNNLMQGHTASAATTTSAATVTTTAVTTTMTPQVPFTFNPQVIASSAPRNSTLIPGIPDTQVSHPSTSTPQVIANAAAHLNAALQSGLGQPGHGYNGLTMENLRSNQQIVSQAANILANATQSVPPLNPAAFLGATAATQNCNNQVSSIDQLYRATTVNKQLRCYEFASTGQFSYRSQLKAENCNAVAFAYGAFKHLEALKSGLIPNVSDTEFLARIRHLRNVFEVACLSSSLNNFSDSAWLVAREYDNRVISDIECGAKSWHSLSNGIEPDAIYCAKETVENRQKNSKKPPKNSDKLKEGERKKE